MESCTSGLVATLITNESGASAIMKGAFVTYSNEAKIQQGVREHIIDEYGVYSTATAIEMAKACRNAYNAYIGIGITGVLDRIDPANITETKNIYYAISIGNNTQAYTITIPNDITDRFDRKFYVANVIGNILYDQLYDIDTNEDK
jgi:Uncharacterized protein (competence- and mitomycin-induced)